MLSKTSNGIKDASPLIKSPSDTTIYAPALKMAPNNQVAGVVERFLIDNRNMENNSRMKEFVNNTKGVQNPTQDTAVGKDRGDVQFVNQTPKQISQFVEQIRADGDRARVGNA